MVTPAVVCSDAWIRVLVLGGDIVRCVVGRGAVGVRYGDVLVVDCGAVRRSLSVDRFWLDSDRSCPLTNGNSIPKHNPATVRIRSVLVQLPQRGGNVFIPNVCDLERVPNHRASVKCQP